MHVCTEWKEGSFLIIHINIVFLKSIHLGNVHTLSNSPKDKRSRLCVYQHSSTQSFIHMEFAIRVPLLFCPDTLMELFCKDCAENKQSPSPGTLSRTHKTSNFTSSVGIPSGHQLHRCNCMLSADWNKHGASTNTCLVSYVGWTRGRHGLE